MKKYYIYDCGYWSKYGKQGYWSDHESNGAKINRIEYSKFFGSLMILFMKIMSNSDLRPRLVKINKEEDLQ